MSDIQEKIGQEIAEAREICSTEGSTSKSCAAAWDAVEELQAEASHQKVETSSSESAFSKYCEDNPEADECRIYED